MRVLAPDDGDHRPLGPDAREDRVGPVNILLPMQLCVVGADQLGEFQTASHRVSTWQPKTVAVRAIASLPLTLALSGSQQ